MADSEIVNRFIDTIKKDIPGLIAVSVVNVATGNSLGMHSNDPSFNPEVASAYNVEVVKAKLKAINALHLSEPIDHILIELKTQYHIIKVTEDGKYMAYVATRKAETNLALARSVTRANMNNLERKLK